MLFRSKNRSFRSALLSLRRRVLSDGEILFRVISDNSESRDFTKMVSESYNSCKRRAREYALDLASTRIGSSVFVSERRELDGVQCLVGVTEVRFEDFKNGI